jgi:hypothetical protein
MALRTTLLRIARNAEDQGIGGNARSSLVTALRGHGLERSESSGPNLRYASLVSSPKPQMVWAF